MKKLLLLTLTFMAYIGFSQCVDPVISDFECDPPSHPFTGAITSIANPVSGGINTSANVGQYTDNGTDGYDNLYVDYGTTIDLSTNNQLKFKIYSPTSIQVLAKLEGGTVQEIWSSFSAVNTWEEFTFDFSASAGNGNTKVILFFNATVTTGTASDVYFIDDLKWNSPNSLLWTGATDSDWDTASNWSPALIPSSTSDVSINSGLTNYPTAISAIDVNSITMASGSSLIAQSSVSGNITYNRSLSTSNWYSVASPVVGQDEDDFVTASGLKTGTGNNVALGNYNTATDTWNYYQSGSSSAAKLVSGTGYIVSLQGASGDIAFTGTLLTSDLTPINLSTTGNGFNLVGNPYPSFINSNTLLTMNSTSLLSETIWIWDQSTANYVTKVAVDGFQIAPGQGFFVQSNGVAGTLSINEAFQSHQGTNTFLKGTNPRPEIHLNLTDGTSNKFTKIYYIEGTTIGFDNGFDGPTFGGVGSEGFNIYSIEAANNKGKNLAIQSLPKNNYENMVIPIGVNANSGSQITFTTTVFNLPDDINVYLEDTATETFTKLNENNASYQVTLSSKSNGSGRFYIHTTTDNVLSSGEEFVLDHINIYTTQSNNLRIDGVQNGENAQIQLHNLLGQKVLATSFIGNGIDDIKLSNIKPGVYIVTLTTDQVKKIQKIVVE